MATSLEIAPGTVFNTAAENGCVALAAPDYMGNFMARDSDGVECEFSMVMVCRPGSGHTADRGECACTR